MESYIYVEPSEEGIEPITKQIASKIRRVAPELRGPLKGISIGNQLEGKETELKGFVDELIVVEVPSGAETNTEVISKVLVDVAGNSGPSMLFFGATYQGMELAPGVGWRLGVPVITNCAAFEWDGSQANVKRPIQGGKLSVSLGVNVELGAVITVQKGAWKEDEPSPDEVSSISVTRIPWKDSWSAEKAEVLGISEESLEGEEDITKADILISVGRGLGDPENLPVMKELAEKLGGMLSCSRPVVDLGWLPASRQVGISGRTVAPVIYLALGISGQSNHLAGINPSGMIIAVNKDPRAPIFTVADYGIEEDILEFIPEFLEVIKQKKLS
jgi:electron transfer flavoprotein alpha subunit